MSKKNVSVNVQSKKYKLNKQDMKKIGKGACIAMGGALLTFAADIIPNIDFGEYTVIIVPIASILINVGLKAFKSN